MKPFLPALAFCVLSFPMLALWIDYCNPHFALRPLLYLALFVSWIFAFLIGVFIYAFYSERKNMSARGAIILGSIIITAHYPLNGLLTAHAEERIIQYKVKHRDPHDDMGAEYLYGSFSPGAGGSSRGVMDAADYAVRDLKNGLVESIIWLPTLWIASLLWYRRPKKPFNQSDC